MWPPRPCDFICATECFSSRKHAIQIGGQRGLPLLVAHLVNGNFVRRPHAVIYYQHIQRPEMLYRRAHQRFRASHPGEISLHRMADVGAAFRDQLFRLRCVLVHS